MQPNPITDDDFLTLVLQVLVNDWLQPGIPIPTNTVIDPSATGLPDAAFALPTDGVVETSSSSDPVPDADTVSNSGSTPEEHRRDGVSRHRTASTPRPRFKVSGRTYYRRALTENERTRAEAVAERQRQDSLFATLRYEAAV